MLLYKVSGGQRRLLHFACVFRITSKTVGIFYLVSGRHLLLGVWKASSTWCLEGIFCLVTGRHLLLGVWKASSTWCLVGIFYLVSGRHLLLGVW